MSLIAQLTGCIQAVGADIKALFANQGSLASLATTDKTSLVAAINEVQASGGGAAPTLLTLSETAETSATSWGDIDPGLAWDVEAGATYMVQGALVYQSAAAATGIGIRLTGVSGSYDRFCGEAMIYTLSGAQYVVHFSSPAANTNPSASVGSADTDTHAVLSAIIMPSTAGRVTLSIRSEIAGSAVRLMAGSSLVVRKP